MQSSINLKQIFTKLSNLKKVNGRDSFSTPVIICPDFLLEKEKKNWKIMLELGVEEKKKWVNYASNNVIQIIHMYWCHIKEHKINRLLRTYINLLKLKGKLKRERRKNNITHWFSCKKGRKIEKILLLFNYFYSKSW